MATPRWDQLWLHVNAATMVPGQLSEGENIFAGDPLYGLIPDAVVAVCGSEIVFVGPRSALPGAPEELAAVVHDGEGSLLTPGLIDCHTHLVYGGDRADEFEARLRGASYEEIARAGGGICSTVRATRALNEEALLAAALPRLDRLIREGVTTVEVKSGYGLSVADELKQLRVARRLATERPVEVRTTFLGAHALPPELAHDRVAYLKQVCEEQLPAVVAEGLADAVDVFCEGIGFSIAESRCLFEHARAIGLPVKIHAEQLSCLGGAALAAEFGALSADHLEYLDDAGVAALAASGSVAVLLPGAFYVLRETQLPPVEALRAAGVPLALATDLNPGSSPIASPLLIMNMGCTLFRLTPAESLAGMTVAAARALGLRDRGQLAVGKRADFVLWSVERPAQLTYQLGLTECRQRVQGGMVHTAP